MKKTLRIRLLMRVLFCMSIVSLFINCNDKEEQEYEIEYPTEESVIELKNEDGILSYNQQEEKWIFSPSDYESFPFPGDEGGISVVINNMKNEYEALAGEVIISGTAKLHHIRVYNKALGHKVFVYNLEIQQIKLYTTTNTRTNAIDTIMQCGTIAPPAPSWLYMRSVNSQTSYDITRNFRVFIHIIRGSNGVGLNKDSYSSIVLSNLNAFFEETNISFSLMGNEYIDSDNLNLTSDATKAFSYNAHSNTIDIYIFSSGINLAYAGIAQNIPSTKYAIKNGYYASSTTVCHELGHCLGLYHTHHGTAINNYAEGGERELVNGSNSTIAGDYISDTPADPCEWNNGIYIGTGKDANGDYYHPSPFNIMSYSGGNRNKLTNFQLERIHSTILNNWRLQAVCNSNETNSIQGKKFIVNHGDYFINVPSNYVVNWTVNELIFTQPTGDATTSTTKHFSGTTFSLNPQSSNITSALYRITANITTPKDILL